MVGLINVDNISDANKPVSSAQLAALNLKVNLASPSIGGTSTHFNLHFNKLMLMCIKD
jgi:hypothetical protein